MTTFPATCGHAPEDYSELLGLYLGDGHISVYPRAQRLRIVLDQKYPTIIVEACGLLKRCFPENRVDVVPAEGLFCSACDPVGVGYRVNQWRCWHVRINRRDSVGLMLANVGLKT